MEQTKYTCERCGAVSDGAEWTASTVTIQANWGSRYDTNRFTIDLCADCIDRVIDTLLDDDTDIVGINSDLTDYSELFKAENR